MRGIPCGGLAGDANIADAPYTTGTGREVLVTQRRGDCNGRGGRFHGTVQALVIRLGPLLRPRLALRYYEPRVWRAAMQHNTTGRENPVEPFQTVRSPTP